MARLTGTRKKVNVKVDFGYPTCSKQGKVFSLCVTDAESTLAILELDMSMEEFANAISGLGCRPAVATLYDTFDKVGLRRVWKQERFVVPGLSKVRWNDPTKTAWDDLLREHIPEVVDGWTVEYPRKNSLSQGQLLDDSISVTLVRYVVVDGPSV